jgi:hypothetical protein
MDTDESSVRSRKTASELQRYKPHVRSHRALKGHIRLTVLEFQPIIGRHGVAECHVKVPRILGRRRS